MPTPNIVPKLNNEGAIGLDGRRWAAGHFETLFRSGSPVYTQADNASEAEINTGTSSTKVVTPVALAPVLEALSLATAPAAQALEAADHDAGTGAPGSPAVGQVWRITGSGSFDNKAWAIGDYALYNGVQYNRLPIDPATVAWAQNLVDTIDDWITDHMNAPNPHGVTKTTVALSNVPDVDATDRDNHTGTQAISTIHNLPDLLDRSAKIEYRLAFELENAPSKLHISAYDAPAVLYTDPAAGVEVDSQLTGRIEVQNIFTVPTPSLVFSLDVPSPYAGVKFRARITASELPKVGDPTKNVYYFEDPHMAVDLMFEERIDIQYETDYKLAQAQGIFKHGLAKASTEIGIHQVVFYNAGRWDLTPTDVVQNNSPTQIANTLWGITMDSASAAEENDSLTVAIGGLICEWDLSPGTAPFYSSGHYFADVTTNDLTRTPTPFYVGEVIHSGNVENSSKYPGPPATNGLYINRKYHTPFTVNVGANDAAPSLGTEAVVFHMPGRRVLSEVRATFRTAWVGGGNINVDVLVDGVSIFTTPVSIDDGETTSTTAATPAVITNHVIPDGAVVRIDVMGTGTGTPGTGLEVHLFGFDHI